ncbi:MAG: hypothetical protein KDB61_07940 [Planctomycetes bacterium]|nr:hypothetical protein [Planctomycetota bacterium]
MALIFSVVVGVQAYSLAAGESWALSVAVGLACLALVRWAGSLFFRHWGFVCEVLDMGDRLSVSRGDVSEEILLQDIRRVAHTSWDPSTLRVFVARDNAIGREFCFSVCPFPWIRETPRQLANELTERIASAREANRGKQS